MDLPVRVRAHWPALAGLRARPWASMAPELADRLLTEGEVAERRHRRDEAIVLADRVLCGSSGWRYAAALSLKAGVLHELGRDQQALGLWDAVIAAERRGELNGAPCPTLGVKARVEKARSRAGRRRPRDAEHLAGLLGERLAQQPRVEVRDELCCLAGSILLVAVTDGLYEPARRLCSDVQHAASDVWNTSPLQALALDPQLEQAVVRTQLMQAVTLNQTREHERAARLIDRVVNSGGVGLAAIDDWLALLETSRSAHRRPQLLMALTLKTLTLAGLGRSREAHLVLASTHELALNRSGALTGLRHVRTSLATQRDQHAAKRRDKETHLDAFGAAAN